MTLDRILSEHAVKRAKKVCLKFDKREITYSEIDNLVNLTSGGLQETGLNTGDRVAILMDNCPEYIVSYFAILRAGGVAVPVNTFLIAGEISYILKDAGCNILIYGTAYRKLIPDIKKQVPGVRTLVFEDIPQKIRACYSGESNETAVILYTSGTTGFPKGAMLTHGNLLSNTESCRQVFQFSERDRVLLFLPLFHSFTFTVCVLLPFYSGGSIVLLESVKPFSRVISSIMKDRITLLVAVPAVYNILARKKVPFFIKMILKLFVRVRACVSGASSLPVDTVTAIEEKFGIPLIEGYGLTEASPVVAVNPIYGVRKPGSVGPPIPGVEVALRHDGNGAEQSAGGPGELMVKGPNVMKGYHNKVTETDEVLKSGWLYTGDMARIDEDGYIYIVDRKKDVIIVDGMNIYPREVEDAACLHPAVEECAMVGVPDGKGSETTVIYIKKKDGTVIDDMDIRKHLKGLVAGFKIPRRARFIDEFPKTATGKIRKNELKKLKIE